MSGNLEDYGYTRDVIEQGRKLMNELDRRGPGAIRLAVRSAGSTRTLPPLVQDFIAGELTNALGMVTGQGRRALDEAERQVDLAGRPTTLRELADMLDTSVKAKSDELAPLVRLDALRATDEEAWSGHAAQLYRYACEGQGEAVGRISDCSDNLAGVLRGLAGHLEGFVTTVTGAILGLIGSAMTLCMSLTAAPETIGGSLWGVIPASVGLLGSVMVAVGVLATNAAVTEQLAQDATASVRAWPKSRFGGRE